MSDAPAPQERHYSTHLQHVLALYPMVATEVPLKVGLGCGQRGGAGTGGAAAKAAGFLEPRTMCPFSSTIVMVRPSAVFSTLGVLPGHAACA